MKFIDKLAVKVVLAAMLGLGATAFGRAQETRQAPGAMYGNAMAPVIEPGAGEAFDQAPRLAPQQDGLNGPDGAVVIGGEIIGRDPDPFIRLQMMRDNPSRY